MKVVMPLVSCIMPTRNRRQFVSQAIYYFLEQTYSNKELIIVDDGEDSIADLVPKDARIRYLRLGKKLSLAAKRNLACQETHGELIAHWDDDDWMSPNRMSIQIEELLRTGTDICGARELLHYYLEAGQAWLYRYPSGIKLQLAGCSLLYRRTTWETHKFAESDSPDVTQFIKNFNTARVRAISNPNFYIALLHKGNTSNHNLNNVGWQRRPIHEVTQRLGQDREFYVKLRNNNPVRTVDLRNSYSVSCIMPTYNRRTFVPQAIRYFSRQDYPRRELIVVDDGTDPVSDLIPKDDRIRYIKLPKRVSIGEKRNIACEAAKGEIILLWDDDDWYAANRISYQVLPLLQGKTEVTGLNNSFLLHLATGQFWSSKQELQSKMFAKGIVSGTLAFWKLSLSKTVRFPNWSLAEDAQLMRLLVQHGVRIRKLSNTGMFVYIRHKKNTWQFEPGQFLNSNGWQKIQRPDFLPKEDLAFYAQF